MQETIKSNFRVTPEQLGLRLDQHLAAVYPDFSRAQLQSWIKQGDILVDGEKAKPGIRLKGVEQIDVDVTLKVAVIDRPEPMTLDIVFEDEHLLVMNKPPGLVVHPGAGNVTGTLVNGLLNHHPELEKLPRAGVVHRLDKLTSGIMVVAKSLKAHKSLVDQLQDRSMGRSYTALVYGHMIAGGRVDAPIDRHAVHRTRMAVSNGGKNAITHYRIITKYKFFTLLDLTLESGRTHQIRVHMAHIQHPVVCDPVYGPGVRLPRSASDQLVAQLRSFRRQTLHARELRLVHPHSGESMSWSVPIPEDMLALIKAIDS